MKEKILSFVRERGGVSFAELERLLGDAAKGNMALCPSRNPNLVFWAGMSEPFVAAIQEFLAEGKLKAKPTSLLVYLADGALPNMPMAKRNYRYKKPHWVPTVFDAIGVTREDVRRGMQNALHAAGKEVP